MLAGVNTAPVLQTPRLRFFELCEQDAPFVLELLNEPAYVRGIGDKGVRTLADACAYIHDGPVASYRRHGFGLYRVTLSVTSEPIGVCGLLKREVLEHPDLGYALLERHWGQGYAFEAAHAVLEYARDQLGLRRILAITSLDNARSISLLDKLGFAFEAVIPLAGFDGPSRVFVWPP